MRLKYVTNTIKDNITCLEKERDGHRATFDAAAADFLHLTPFSFFIMCND